MTALRVILAATAALFGAVLSVPILMIALLFAAVSLLARAISYLIAPSFKAWSELIKFDSTFGWKPIPHLNTYHYVEDLFHLTTDAQGWRGKSTLAHCNIVVFGDSFAWGYGIDDANFFGDLNPNIHIKAIGANGYNMVQEFLWMRQLAPEIRGKLVVWFIYFGNDLYENIVPDMCGYRAPFVREINGAGEWELVNHHVGPTKWFYALDLQARTRERDYYGKLAAMCRSTFLSRRAFAACEYLIEQGQDLCNEVGARLIIMTIPDAMQLTREGAQSLQARGGYGDSFHPHFPDQQIQTICLKLGVHHIALKDHLDRSHYKKRDCHWNEAGHRQVAKVLSSLYHSCFHIVYVCTIMLSEAA